MRNGDVSAMRVLFICSDLSCGGAPGVPCVSGLGFGAEKRKTWIVSSARRIASVMRDAYERGSALGEARAPLREVYAAMSDGDEGYWDDRKRDHSIRREVSIYACNIGSNGFASTTLVPAPRGIGWVLGGVLFALLLGRWCIRGRRYLRRVGAEF